MPVLELSWAMLMFCLFAAWIAALVLVVADVVVNKEVGGVAKALWILFVIGVPWVGLVVYLIVHGHGINERSHSRVFARHPR